MYHYRWFYSLLEKNYFHLFTNFPKLSRTFILNLKILFATYLLSNHTNRSLHFMIHYNFLHASVSSVNSFLIQFVVVVLFLVHIFHFNRFINIYVRWRYIIEKVFFVKRKTTNKNNNNNNLILYFSCCCYLKWEQTFSSFKTHS